MFAAYRPSVENGADIIVDAAGRVTVIAPLQKITVAVVVATGCQTVYIRHALLLVARIRVGSNRRNILDVK